MTIKLFDVKTKTQIFCYKIEDDMDDDDLGSSVRRFSPDGNTILIQCYQNEKKCYKLVDVKTKTEIINIQTQSTSEEVPD